MKRQYAIGVLVFFCILSWVLFMSKRPSVGYIEISTNNHTNVHQSCPVCPSPPPPNPELQQQPQQLKQPQQLQQCPAAAKERRLTTFERFATLTGPHPQQKYRRNLVVSFFGESSKQQPLIQEWEKYFPEKDFDRMIFVYDNSDWRDWPHYKTSIFVHATKQMKWWYVRRFVHPELVKTYDYIWFVDDDVKPAYNAMDVVASMDKFNIKIGQPARSDAGSHGTLNLQTPPEGVSGRWGDMVEAGPLAIINAKAYDCIYEAILPDVSSGWGLDLIWCKWAVQECGIPEKEACAVFDIHPMQHLNARAASNTPGYNPWAELGYYQSKMGQYWSSVNNPHRF